MSKYTAGEGKAIADLYVGKLSSRKSLVGFCEINFTKEIYRLCEPLLILRIFSLFIFCFFPNFTKIFFYVFFLLQSKLYFQVGKANDRSTSNWKYWSFYAKMNRKKIIHIINIKSRQIKYCARFRGSFSSVFILNWSTWLSFQLFDIWSST